MNKSYTKKISYLRIILTYISYIIGIVIGHIRDQIGKIFMPCKYSKFYHVKNIPPFFTTLESFYVRRLSQRISDCWNRPITGIPETKIAVFERSFTAMNESCKLTGKKSRLLNYASYNYLNFSKVKENDLKVLKDEVFTLNIPQYLVKNHPITKELEKEVCNFLGTEDCMVFQMGYGTNALNIGEIMNGALIFSDENNHTSLINGIAMAHGTTIIFKHNDFNNLKHKLRYHVSQGYPHTHRAYTKIFVVIEGLYSMEGTIPDLEFLIELKRMYKFYIFLDEAHSIGALGNNGRGICEITNVNTKEIDILMGTFTKSFGAYGGYIAGSSELINFIRFKGCFAKHSEMMSPVVAKHSLSCLKEIIEDKSRIRNLSKNVKYMRRKLKKARFIVLGNQQSPVILILITNPGKIAEFSRLCKAKGLAVVVVGFPATSILYSRARICVSSSHTKEELDEAIKIIDSVGTILGMKY